LGKLEIRVGAVERLDRNFYQLIVNYLF
jgi:hypothetical protein